MKKACLVIGIIALVACVTGVPEIVAGIAERGMGGVNYGRIIFPLLVGGAALWFYRKK